MFEKIEDNVIQAQVDKLERTREANAGPASNIAPLKSQIQFDDFMKLDMRVGTITAAEKMPKSKKLLKLTVDTGLDVRTVLSGIAEHFGADEVVGKQVTILANLAPRKMMGVESQGMILMAENEDGSLHFMQPGEAIVNGAVIS
jgi:methionyl-tRNA synthetase